MIDTSKVQFPLTLAGFASLQRNEMRRVPTVQEMEIFSQIVDTANEAYHAAAAGDCDTVEEILSAINCTAAQIPEASHVAALCRGWVMKGMFEGIKILNATINGAN